MEFSVTSLVALPITTFCPSKNSTFSYEESFLESLRFVIFYSRFTICDVAPESMIKQFLSCSWFDVFANG